MKKKSIRSSTQKLIRPAIVLAFAVLLSPALRAQTPSPEPAPIPHPSQPPPASPNAPSPAPSPAPSAGASPSAHMMRTWRQLSYTCDGDAKVVVNLHGTAARVVFKGRTYNMKRVEQPENKTNSAANSSPSTQPGVSGDSEGDKYTDGSVVWRVKGEDGSLERASKSSENKKLASGCHLQSAGPAPSTPPGKTNPAPNQK
jgi:hypothetical protein